MRPLRYLGVFCCAAALASLAGCTGKGGSTEDEGEKYGNYTLHGTYYDQTDPTKAASNAKTVLTQLEGKDNVCLVGLWAYNPPAILSAVKGNNQQGKVHIIGFDEDPITLNGIRDGHIRATVVQQPFKFGYHAIYALYNMLADPKAGRPTEVNKDGIWEVPHEVVDKDNVDAFEKKLQEQKNTRKTVKMPEAKNKVKVAFVTNNDHDFWNLVDAGAYKAAVEINDKHPDKGVEVTFHRTSPGTAQEQKRVIDGLKNQGVQAIAISVNDAKNQTSMINDLADEMPVICVDNDAPQSKRRFYIGTNNVKAGKEVGGLVKKAMPDGTVAIFVGLSDAPNAIERRQGVLDALKEK